MLDRISHTYLYIFRRYPLLVWLGLVSVCSELGYAVIVPILPLYLHHELHTSVIFIGYVVAAFAISETIFKAPCGSLGDRIGRKPVILAGCLISCISPLIMSVVTDKYLFLPLRALDGLAAAALWPTMTALIGDTVESEDRATAMSVFNTSYMIGLGFGSGLGLFVGGLLGSDRYAFRCTSVLLLLGFLIGLLKIHRTPCLARPHREESHISFLAILRGTPMLIYMLVIFAVLQFGTTLIAPVLVLYANDVIGISQLQMVWLFLAPAILVAIMALPMGRFADKIGRAHAVHVALLAATIAMVLVPFARGATEMMGLAALLGLSYALATPAWLALTSVLAPPNRQGEALGMMNTAQGLGFCIGPIVGTRLWHHVAVRAPFWFSACVLLICLVAALMLIRDEPKQDREQ